MRFIQHFVIVHSVLKYAGMFPIVKDTQEAINLAKHYRIKSEIIGQWLFCFTTDLIGVQLQTIGFWYSYKHSAYVYSGGPKQDMADDESLDEIRQRLGSYRIS